MTDDIIERVARAICNADMKGYGGCFYPECRDNCLPQQIPLARAAIEAMREPTDEMVAVGCAAAYPATDDEAIACWQHMIDEALSTKEKAPAP